MSDFFRALLSASKPAPYTTADTLADALQLVQLTPSMLRECRALCRCAFCNALLERRRLAGCLMTGANEETLPVVLALCEGCLPVATAGMDGDRALMALADTPTCAVVFHGDEAARVTAIQHMLSCAVHECLDSTVGKPLLMRTLRLAWRMKGLTEDAGLDRWGLAAWRDDDGSQQLHRVPFPWFPEDPPAMRGHSAEQAREFAIGLAAGRLTFDVAAWTAGAPVVTVDVVERGGMAQ